MIKKKLLTLVYYYLNIIYFLRTSVWCFNIENRDPWVKKAPDGQLHSYFGFSVALHQSSNSNKIGDNWILIGAPLGKNLQPGTNFSGAVFKCPITENNYDCIQIETDGQRQSGGRYLFNDFDYGDEDEDPNARAELQPPQVDEIKDGQWLGVSVKSQKPGGQVLACAHRYIQSPDLSKNHNGQGLCYLLDHNLKTTDSLQFCKGLPTEKLHQQYGFCQIGTSVSFVGDSALVGAPGPYTWRGTVFGQVIEGDFLDRDKTIYRGPLNDNPAPIDKYSYLGMSVGGGHVLKKNKYTYVSGAPRSQMVGQVYFFEKRPNVGANEEFEIPLIITGEQFAASFGYEVLVVDVNNDGWDDVLVSAPFYYGDNKGGAVYIYYNLRNCTNSKSNCTIDKILYGSEQSRFGFSMTSLGDINKDGFNDVAIGAPYDQNHGAVYIYLGSNDGLKNEPSQIINFRQLTTFGYSLSGGLDMDSNGYPDLLVGAYESDVAILLLTRPIIDIKIKINSADMYNINATKKGCAQDPNNLNYTCFSIQSCFSIVGTTNNLPSFKVLYNITELQKIIPRIWFRNNKHADTIKNFNKGTITVTDTNRPYCQREIVYIKDGVSDILSPIKFKVNYTLEDDNKPHSPILNTTSIKEFEATFQKDCGSDDVCESMLEITAGTNFKKNEEQQYIVDMLDKEFILEANISNKGESAYEAKFFVFHPATLSYINLKTEKDQTANVKCSFKNDSLVVCDLGNPFQANKMVNLKLRFEIIKNSKEQQIELHLKVNSTSTELSKKTEENLIVVLQKVAIFSITGKGTSNIFYGGNVIGESGMNYLEDIGARVIHRYYVDNRGQWDIPDMKVLIDWPYQVAPGKIGQEGKWLLYLEAIPEVIVDGTAKSGFCNVQNAEAVVNPRSYSLKSSSLDAPANLELFEFRNDNNDNNNNNNTNTVLRRKRDTEYVIQSKEIEKNGKKRQVVQMQCGQSARCALIECYILGLKKQNHGYIEIKSRIWNSTLVEDYSNVDWVQISSRAKVDILDSSFITTPNQIFAVWTETRAYPENISPYSSLNWWVIGGAILAGILLLLVLIVILYKCGFFKRKRAKDETLCGNIIEKSEESNTLLKK